MIPVVEQLQAATAGDDAYWWALALGACFGGNATLDRRRRQRRRRRHGRARRPADRLRGVPQGRACRSRSSRMLHRHRLHRRAVLYEPARTVTDPLLRERRCCTQRDTVGDATRAAARHRPAGAAGGRRARAASPASSASASSSAALFPGYLKELKYAGFVTRTLDDALEKRHECRDEPVEQLHEHRARRRRHATSPTPRSPRSSSTTAC